MPQQNDYLISARMRPTSKEESKLPLVEVINPPDLTLPKVEEEREREEGIAKPFPQEADTKGATRSKSKAIIEEDPHLASCARAPNEFTNAQISLLSRHSRQG